MAVEVVIHRIRVASVMSRAMIMDCFAEILDFLILIVDDIFKVYDLLILRFNCITKVIDLLHLSINFKTSTVDFSICSSIRVCWLVMVFSAVYNRAVQFCEFPLFAFGCKWKFLECGLMPFCCSCWRCLGQSEGELLLAVNPVSLHLVSGGLLLVLKLWLYTFVERSWVVSVMNQVFLRYHEVSEAVLWFGRVLELFSWSLVLEISQRRCEVVSMDLWKAACLRR